MRRHKDKCDYRPLKPPQPPPVPAPPVFEPDELPRPARRPSVVGMAGARVCAHPGPCGCSDAVVLGVPLDATPETVKMAFREHARALHPDKADDGAERFMKVRQAYSRLLAAAERGGGGRTVFAQCEVGPAVVRGFCDGSFEADDPRTGKPIDLEVEASQGAAGQLRAAAFAPSLRAVGSVDRADSWGCFAEHAARAVPVVAAGVALDWPCRTWEPLDLVHYADGPEPWVSREALAAVGLADFWPASCPPGLDALGKLPPQYRPGARCSRVSWALRREIRTPPLLCGCLVAALHGRRAVLLYPPVDLPSLFPARESADAEAPGRRALAEPLRVTLSPGDVLLVPPFWGYAERPYDTTGEEVLTLTSGFMPSAFMNVVRAIVLALKIGVR